MENAEVEIVWRGTKRHAELLLSSISPDDPESFFAEIIENESGSELKIKVVSKDLKSIRITIDDLLVCLAAVDLSLDVIKEK